jgi:hypothetical protein
MKRYFFVFSFIILWLDISNGQSKGSEAEALIPPSPLKEEEGLAELPQKTYYAVGTRIRWIAVPKFFLSLFFKESIPAHNPGVGLEFIRRKAELDLIASLWWAGYMTKSGNFWYKEDPIQDTEYIENSLSLLILQVDFLFSHSFKDWFAITYGGGAGLGFVLGNLVRTDTYTGDIASKRPKCPSPNYSPSDSGCQDYNKKWDKWPVAPWVNVLLGARFKPHRHIVARIDFGFGLGFQLGMAVAYMF